MVSFEQPSKEWETLDFLLVQAYEILQDSFVCPKCGGWIWECSSEYDKARNLKHEIKDVICFKSRAIEQHEFSKRPSDERKLTKQSDKDRWGCYPKVKSCIPELHREMLTEPSAEDYLLSIQASSSLPA